MLTEAQAWREAAKVARENGFGLCSAIDDLYVWFDHKQGKISLRTRDRMFSRIYQEGRRRGVDMASGYIWPVTPAGYRARTRWAYNQARECEARAKARKARRAKKR